MPCSKLLPVQEWGADPQALLTPGAQGCTATPAVSRPSRVLRLRGGAAWSAGTVQRVQNTWPGDPESGKRCGADLALEVCTVPLGTKAQRPAGEAPLCSVSPAGTRP